MNYFKYINRRVKLSKFDSMRFEHNPVPYNQPHVEFAKHRFSHIQIKRGFDKWYKYPDSAYRIYWRFHPKYW